MLPLGNARSHIDMVDEVVFVGRWCQIHALSLRIVQSSFINLCGQPGSYCNHYFLRMLAMISRGHYDAVFDAG